MKFFVSTDVGTWTNWLAFEPDPDHPDLGTGFTPDFWILAGYLKKLWTNFDEILWVDSCGSLHDLVTFWAGFSSESGSWIRTCIQNCKADNAKSNGRISVKFYEWISCESRKTAFNFGSDMDHSGCRIRILPRLLTTADFYEIWCRDGAYTGKSWVNCRSTRSKVKVNHNKSTH